MNHREFWEGKMSFWLSGTTCSRRTKTIDWISDDGRFALFRHHGHSEYIDRFTGSMWCETYFTLRDASNLDPKGSSWDFQKGIKEWKGRWSKAKEKEMMDKIEEVQGVPPNRRG